MTDLTYCHSHMTDEVIRSADFLANLEEELIEEDLEIPPNAIPPSPDDCEVLPSQVHPSYPYGDPTNVNHPASQPRTNGDPVSRMLFVDSMYTGAVARGSCWDELALDHILPMNKEKVDAEKAAHARETAVGNMQPQNSREDSSDDERGENGNE